MLFSQLAISRPFSPREETVTPKNTVNTIRARICPLEITSGKSPTVKVLTIWSPILEAAACAVVSPAPNWTEVSTPKIFNTINIKLPAIAAVITKISKVKPNSFPTLFVSLMLAMELEIEKKSSGTSSTNSRFSQIWPIGYRNDAFSPITIPMMAPKITKAIRISGSR